MKIILGLMALLMTQNAVAACDANGCTGTPKELFRNFYLTAISSGQIYFELIDGKDKLDCTLAEGKSIVMMSSHPLFKEMYSTILSASALDKRIHVRIKNGSEKCEIGYIRYLL